MYIGKPPVVWLVILLLAPLSLSRAADAPRPLPGYLDRSLLSAVAADLPGADQLPVTVEMRVRLHSLSIPVSEFNSFLVCPINGLKKAIFKVYWKKDQVGNYNPVTGNTINGLEPWAVGPWVAGYTDQQAQHPVNVPSF